MKINKEVLAKWKDDAKDATQGSWYWSHEKNYSELMSCDRFVIADDGSACGEYPRVIDPYASDAKHIANACPQNFIALIEKLERYEKYLWEIAHTGYVGFSVQHYVDLAKEALEQE